MRCPDCSKFVGMENGDPQVNSLEVSYDSGCIEFECSVTHTRNCADCGTELKSCDYDLTKSIDAKDMLNHSKLSKKQQELMLSALEANSADLSVEEGSA